MRLLFHRDYWLPLNFPLVNLTPDYPASTSKFFLLYLDGPNSFRVSGLLHYLLLKHSVNVSELQS